LSAEQVEVNENEEAEKGEGSRNISVRGLPGVSSYEDLYGTRDTDYDDILPGGDGYGSGAEDYYGLGGD